MFGISSGGLLHQQYHKEYVLERLGKNQSFTTGGNSLKLPPPSKSHLGLLPQGIPTLCFICRCYCTVTSKNLLNSRGQNAILSKEIKCQKKNLIIPKLQKHFLQSCWNLWKASDRLDQTRHMSKMQGMPSTTRSLMHALLRRRQKPSYMAKREKSRSSQRLRSRQICSLWRSHGPDQGNFPARVYKLWDLEKDPTCILTVRLASSILSLQKIHPFDSQRLPFHGNKLQYLLMEAVVDSRVTIMKNCCNQKPCLLIKSINIFHQTRCNNIT